MIHTRRRVLATLGAALVLCAATAQAQAQSYPNRTIRIVVPYPAGSSLELIARTAAETFLKQWGQPAIVANMPGGSAAIGTRHVAQAEPDGYTLLLGTNQTHGANSALYPNLGYDPIKDFQPVAGLGRLQHVLVVRRDLGVRSLDAFIALARKPGAPLNYGSSGNGSASHLAAEMFKRSTGVPLTHIPYKGSVDAVQAVLGGHIDATFTTLPSVLPFVRNQSVIALAVASRDRSSQLPEIPTLAELGVANAEADAWTALFVPAKTPPDIVARLSSTARQAFADPAVNQKIVAAGFVAEVVTPDAFRAFLAEDMARWAAIVKAADIKMD